MGKYRRRESTSTTLTTSAISLDMAQLSLKLLTSYYFIYFKFILIGGGKILFYYYKSLRSRG